MNCFKCDTELELNCPDLVKEGETPYQFDNALWIAFHGGYGMFVESAWILDDPKRTDRFPGAAYEFVICHDCAHEFMDNNPWLKNLFDPRQSHSHKMKYVEANPDHYGWDYDHRANPDVH